MHRDIFGSVVICAFDNGQGCDLATIVQILAKVFVVCLFNNLEATQADLFADNCG
ncbi:Uncharacterised protein [Mycobacteroides abscessus subsp. abscessus]|nr:Uncharacterised protein [Mycobacteroides abscessus subsp. abscessus]